MKELLELSDQFYEEFTKLTFYRYIKTWCNEIKLITKRKRFYCVHQNLKNWFRRIYFDSAKKSSSQSIEKKDKKEI